MQVTIDTSGPSRQLRHWNGNGLDPRTNAKRYARKHGAAGAWMADASYLLFYMDGDKLRQKTFRDVVGKLPV